MYNNGADLLFPTRVIPSLRLLRGQPWRDLVDQVLAAEQSAPSLDRIAFILMMVRLVGCASCQADSYRALQGCAVCASQTVRRYRGKDEDLAALFANAKREIEKQSLKRDSRNAQN